MHGNEPQYAHNRRHPLSQEELTDIKDQLLESIYADIGRSLTAKFLWVFGAVVASVFAGLTASGRIKIG